MRHARRTRCRRRRPNSAPPTDVILVVRLFGLEFLHIELAQPSDTTDDDWSRDLSGGITASTPINVALRPADDMARPEWDYPEEE